MVIGTSNGNIYEDMLHMEARNFDVNDTGEQKPELDTLDQNVVTPDQYAKNKAIADDPKNIYDDQGNLVDYDFWGTGPKAQPQITIPEKRSESPATVQTVSDWGVKMYGINPMLDLENSVSGGGGGVVPFRPKPKNDNEAGLYNPREPNMIGSKEMDAHIDRTWKFFGDSQKKAAEAEKLMKKENFSEIDAARVKKLQKEAADLMKESDVLLNSEPTTKLSPQLKAQSEKIVQESMERKLKLTPEQRAAERDINNRSMKTPERVSEDVLYREMKELLSVKNPSNMQKDRIQQLNKMLDAI